LWNDGQTNVIATGLIAGTYTVTITDVNNCTATAQATVAYDCPCTLSAAANATNTTCAGNDATAFVTTVGGFPPFQYQWDANAGSQITASVSGLSIGTYSVTISDNNNCAVVSQILVLDGCNCSLVATYSVANTTCTGSDGSASATPNGGIAPYTYQWDANAGSQITPTAVGLDIGVYNVLITDANGCSINGQVSIYDGCNCNLTTSIAPINTTCLGNDGQAAVNVAGGTAPFTYEWDGATGYQTTQVAIGLVPGTYSVVVKDANGCANQSSVIIFDGCNCSVPTTSTSTSTTCAGNDGTATINITGVNTPYSIQWDAAAGNQTTATASGLVPGTYSVIVEDANGCKSNNQIIVFDGCGCTLTVSTSVLNESCVGGDGAASVTPAGGTSPYSYQWDANANNQTTNTAINLTAGTYNIIVTDANGCQLNQQATVFDNCNCTLAGTVSTTATTCAGVLGTANINATAGTSPYSYQWDAAAGSQTTPAVTGLAVGSYDATITDALGCQFFVQAIIQDGCNCGMTATTTTVGESCIGNDGEATATPVGGIAPYTYQWDANANNQNTPTAINLTVGSYSVTILDVNGCSIAATIVIQAIPDPVVTINGPTGTVCTGSLAFDALVSQGQSPYSYLWSNGETTPSTTAIFQAAGVMSVTVTDANGCVATDDFSVNPLTSPTVWIATSNGPNMCLGASKTLQAVAFGSLAPYSFIWSTGATINPIVVAPTVSTTYSVTVTDGNGCEVVWNSLIEVNPVPIVNVTVSTVQCGEVAEAIVTNGTAPYSYNWDNGEITQIATALTVGTHTVIVTDDKGCTTTGSATINNSNLLTNSAQQDSPVTCNAGADGSATITVTAGLSPYTYLWSNGETTATAIALLGGVHTYDVVDAVGCTGFGSVTIMEPSTYVISVVATNVTCNGSADGSIDLTVSGATPPYTFAWDNGLPPIEDPTSLGPNTYTVTITDANACTTIESTTITGPSAISISGIGKDISCYGANDGSIDLTINGGNMPYTFVWSNGVPPVEDPTGLSPGVYAVTMTDANGCVTGLSFILTQPLEILVLKSISAVSCNGTADGSIDLTVSGGAGNFTFQWDQGLPPIEDPTGLSGGTYNVTITDDDGCEQYESVTINEPTAMTTASAVTNIACGGPATGIIDITVNGGVAPYNYEWNNGETTEDITGLTAGTYTVTITDDNGCTQTASDVITAAGGLGFSSTNTNVNCFGGANGSIDLTVVGGSSPYTYQWDNGLPPVDNPSGLSAGTYNVTITDGSGCEIYGSETITEPSQLTNLSTVIDAACGGNNGSIALTVNGGTGAYTYLWDNGLPPVAIQTGMSAGTYNVTITDDNGCELLVTETVGQSGALGMSATITSAISCNGDADGVIDVTIVGGVSPYTYNWSNGEVTEDISGLAAGTYTLNVIDDNGCTGVLSETLIDPALLSISSIAMTDSVTCSGGDDGAAEITIAGGTTPYTIVWDNGELSTTAIILDGGFAFVTVTDDNGCATIDSTFIGEPLGVDSVRAGVSCGGSNYGSVVVFPEANNGNFIYSIDGTNWQTDSVFTGVAVGSYEPIVEDTLNGCIYVQDSVHVVEVGSQDLFPEFLVPAEGVINQQFVAIEISWPVPDSVHWVVDAAITMTGDTLNHAYFEANATGTYTVELVAYYGNCAVSEYKTINILSDPGDLTPPGTPGGFTDVKRFVLYPNPNDGTFSIEVGLVVAKDIQLRIYHETSLLLDSRQVTGSDNYIEAYSFQNLQPGYYIAQVITDVGVYNLKFVVTN